MRIQGAGFQGSCRERMWQIVANKAARQSMTCDILPSLAFTLRNTTTMSTSFATSPDSGLSGPHTPPRTSVPLAKSSPVGKVYPYFLPENRDQYQKFGIEDTFWRGKFDKSQFLQFLGVELPNSVPDVPSRGKKYFLILANEVAKSIRDQREHYYLFLYLAFLPTYNFHFRFPRSQNPSVQGHGKQITTWTRYGHKVQARHHGCL